MLRGGGEPSRRCRAGVTGAVTGGITEKGLNGRSAPRQGLRTGEPLGDPSVAVETRELG